jgi:ankyrin repeat protein
MPAVLHVRCLILGWSWLVQGKSAALHAALPGRTDALALLIELAHADLNLQDKKGWAPLHAAATQGQTAEVKMLVDSTAYIDLQTGTGWYQ